MVETMIESWIQAQKKVWEGWSAASRAALASCASTQQMIDCCSEAFGQQAAWSGAPPAAGEGAGAGTEAPIRDGAADPSRIGSLYLEELEKLAGTLLDVWPAPEQLRKAAAGDRSAAVDLAGLAWDAWERTAGRLLHAPGMGITRELNDRMVRTLDSWLDYCRTSFEYQMALAGAWSHARDELVVELKARAARGEGVGSLRDLVVLWSEVGERALVEIFGSDEYARLQGRFLNAAMALRLRQREMVEDLLRGSHLPTRSELDEATRGVYELRKELRRVERLLREAKGRADGSEGQPPGPGGRGRSKQRPSRAQRAGERADGPMEPFRPEPRSVARNNGHA